MGGCIMDKIDREKLRDNIWYFGAMKGLRIGDIERYIGRRLGIISRWRRNNTENIPLDDVYNISILLGITIDDLINTDVKAIKKQREISELKEQRELIDKLIEQLEGDKNES